MPQKAKFTREEILDAALNIVRKRGVGFLTARNIGAELNSSTRPIFTVFDSMDDVHNEVIDYARSLYDNYILDDVNDDELYFKRVGEQYIKFSIAEPKLFQLLFMREQKKKFDFVDVLPHIENNYDRILLSIEKQCKLSRDDSKRLYQHLWVYTHGIASLCATKMCTFTGQQISDMMTEVFRSILEKLKK